MNPKIILRADGNPTIGFGHVYRLLALADILKNDFTISFAISQPNSFLADTIKSHGAEIVVLPPLEYTIPYHKQDGEEVSFDLTLKGEEIVVLDGYWFGEQYQKAVKRTAARLVCIDDFANQYFYADAVINHAPGLSQSMYKGESSTRYYLGLDYAMLRQEFFRPFPNTRNSGAVLISMGGSDQYRISGKVLHAAINADMFSEIHVLASSAFLHEELQRLKDMKTFSKSVVIHKNLSGSALADVMDACTYAIVSASTVLLECYFRGVDCFTGFYTANQLNIYKGFVNESRACGLGDLNNFDSEARFNVESIENLDLPISAMNTSQNLKSIFTNLC